VDTKRDLRSGTPERPAGYVQPPDRHRALRWALALAGGLVVVFAVLFAVGRRGVVSPGAVSSGHAAIGSRCAECHDVGRSALLRRGSSVSDLRCERCHDPGASDRLLQTSHAARGTGITAAAHSSETIACATCHAEHRGGSDLAHAGGDRDCVSCHAFASLAKHPEFAAVAARATTGVGLLFTHDRHIAEVRKEGGQRCEACHQPTADLSGFEPIDFDTHCASCHTTGGAVNGETDPFDGRSLLPVPGSGGPRVAPGARSLVVVSGMAHRDQWVLDNLTRLRRIVDPEGDRADRVALQTRIASLSSVLQTQSLSSLALTDLERLRDSLIRDRDALAATPATAGQDAKALAEMTAAIARVAGTLNDAAAPPAPPTPAPESPEDVRARFEARKAELFALLDAVTARGNPDTTARAAALRARVQALAFVPRANTADADQLRNRLRALDDMFRVLRGLPDQQAASEAATVEALRDAATRQISGGLSLDQFEARRRELLRLLDAIGRQGDPALAARVAPLRQRVLMLRAGDATIEQRRARTQRMIDRVSLEIELAKSGETAAPSAVAPQRDRTIAQPLVARLTRQLAQLNAAPAAPPDTLTAAAAASAAAALAGPCAKCHVIDGGRLEPVAAASRVFRRATFTHKPHLPQSDCLSCHGAVTTSKHATDLVVPGVASCQTCHAPSKARTDCAACHTYHPAASAQLADLR
jgi:TolA-binding protein